MSWLKIYISQKGNLRLCFLQYNLNIWFKNHLIGDSKTVNLSQFQAKKNIKVLL